MRHFRRVSRIPESVILYRGPSQLDGAPIVVIATGLRRASKNPKTGRMVQTWIMRDDIAPHIAAGPNGADVSVCGDCPHRYNPETGHRTCYVTPHQAPLAVWKRRNVLPMASGAVRAYLRTCRSVRMGAYGDPAAVPVSVWESVVDLSRRGHTGYTHQWRTHPELHPYVMASCDSLADYAEAVRLGWRTFRVSDSVQPAKGEIVCVNTARGTTCEACGICNGTFHKGPNVTIAVHGSGARHFRILA